MSRYRCCIRCGSGRTKTQITANGYRCVNVLGCQRRVHERHTIPLSRKTSDGSKRRTG